MQASDGREIVTIVLSPVERRGNGSRDFVRTIDNGLLLSRNIISANSIGSLDPLRRILERAALELAFLHEVEATSIWGPRTDSFWLSYAGGCKFFWILDGIFWNRCRQAGRVEIELGYFEEAGISDGWMYKVTTKHFRRETYKERLRSHPRQTRRRKARFASGPSHLRAKYYWSRRPHCFPGYQGWEPEQENGRQRARNGDGGS
jgi:hypothetical protein